MSYPQPDADQYAIAGYQFFRLNTLLSSPGDIYQSAQSGHGVAIGPESDIANVNLAYFDSQVPTFMQRTVISPTRSFVGRVDARNDSTYSPAQRPGKLLFWSDDLYDPNYRPIALPAAFNEAHDLVQFVAPRLDVIEYFKPINSLVPPRQDKEFVFQTYALTTGGKFYLVVPYYGRKYCYVEFTNRNQVQPNVIGIVGVNYAITQDDSATPYHQEKTILAQGSIAPNANVTKIISCAVEGMFDALVFNFSDVGPAPLRITMSDTPGG